MKKTLLSTSLAIAMGCAGAAHAAPIKLQNGPLYFQFNNLEQVDTRTDGSGNPKNGISVPGGSIDINGDGNPDTPATEGNWGVFNISSVQAGAIATPNQDINGGDGYFLDDGVGDLLGMGQISGIFYGITLTSSTTATGGWMDIYWEDAATDDITADYLNGIGFTPSERTAANLAGDFTDGTFLVRLEFASGIIQGDDETTIQSNINILGATSLNGQSDSYANVVDINNDGVIDELDGPWAPKLNQDWFYVDTNGNNIFGEDGETRDVRFSTFFNNLSSWDSTTAGILGLRSNDPGRAYVPAPATLALMGAGLLGVGFGACRRKAKTAQ